MTHLLMLRFVVVVALALSAIAMGVQEQPFIPDQSNSWAFDPTGDPFAPSPIDLRFLNEATAGASGFVRVAPDGRTLLRGDGKPLRFWATHAMIPHAWSETQAWTHARFLARLGVNLVRTGAIMKPAPGQPDINRPDAEDLRQIWRTVAYMKAQGIYTMISPAWLHDGFTQDPGIEGYGPNENLYNVMFVEPKLQAAYKAWIKELYTATNPYTGVALKDEPAVIALEVFNEDTMLFFTFDGLKGGPLRTLQQRFGAWAAQRYGTLDKALAAWGHVGAQGDDLPAGRLGLMTWWFATEEGRRVVPSMARLSDQLRFIAELQRAFHADMKRYMHTTLGCKQLITASNFHATDKSLEDIENWTKTAGDIICANTYVACNHQGPATSYRIDPGDTFSSASCTRDLLGLPMLKKQVIDRPYWVTETLWVNPHEYQNEAALLTAIYNGVTGVGATFFAGPRNVTWAGDIYYRFIPDIGQGHPMMKWNCSEPGHMGSFPAAALLQRLGCIPAPTPALVERRTFDDMAALTLPMIAEGGEYDPNRYAGGKLAGGVAGVVPPQMFLVGPVYVSHSTAAVSYVAPRALVAATNRPIAGANGVVAADPAHGLVTLDAPGAHAVIGFLKSAGPIRLSAMTLVCDAVHAGVAVVALDGLPLTTSTNILVQLAPRVRPTDWRVEPVAATPSGEQRWRIAATGRTPFRVEKLHGTLALANPRLRRATRLNENGEPAGAISVRRHRAGITFDLPNNALFVLLN